MCGDLISCYKSIENQIVCSQFIAQYILATGWKIIKQTK